LANRTQSQLGTVVSQQPVVPHTLAHVAHAPPCDPAIPIGWQRSGYTQDWHVTFLLPQKPSSVPA
jgi:hypothetical protein